MLRRCGELVAGRRVRLMWLSPTPPNKHVGILARIQLQPSPERRTSSVGLRQHLRRVYAAKTLHLESTNRCNIHGRNAIVFVAGASRQTSDHIHAFKSFQALHHHRPQNTPRWVIQRSHRRKPSINGSLASYVQGLLEVLVPPVPVEVSRPRADKYVHYLAWL